MVVKTYRGLLDDRAQETIPLSTKDGSVGYRIVKFLVMPTGATSGFAYESFIQIWKKEQATVPSDGAPNFSDSVLLACIYYSQSGSAETNPEDMTVVFDTEVFNQDIFITHSNSAGAASINYYFELEQMKLDHTQNMSATLKAIRGVAVD